MSKILLTGATGFIGSHIAEYFSGKGEDIKCLVRENSDVSFLKTLGVQMFTGDVTDEQSINKALVDCETIIHIAGYARDWGRKKDFKRINVEGTLNILRAAKKQNISKVIITGSVSSYGEENCFIKKDETSPYNSHYPCFLDHVLPCKMNYYRDSKAQLTVQSIEFANKNNLNLIIIEPAWVFGEREFQTGFFEYIKSVKNGTSLLPGSAKNKFHVIYAKELARAYFMAYKSNITGVQRIIIGNREAELQQNIYKIFCEKAGLKKPGNIPKALIYPVALIMELFATIFKFKNPPLLTRGRVNMFYDNIEYDTTKAKKILGFETELKLDESIEKTVNWYKDKGYL